MAEPEIDVDGEIGEVADLALTEVKRRLKDPSLAADLPGTMLLQIAVQGAKEKQKKADQERNKEKEVPRGTGVSVILSSSASPERKREMLELERARMEMEYALVKEALDGDL